MFASVGAAAVLLLAQYANAEAQRATAAIVTPAQAPPTTVNAAAQSSYAPIQSLPPASNTGFIYTTPTTKWSVPTFPTASPLPVCSETMCPSLNGKRCQDSTGATYGVMCDQRLSGTIITSSGKHKKEKMMIRDVDESEEKGVLTKRTYAGSLDICAGLCAQFSTKLCTGVDYSGGYCHAYSVILGPFSAPGEIAMLRQS